MASWPPLPPLPPLAGVWRLFSGLTPDLEALLPLEVLPEPPGVEVSMARGGRAGERKLPGFDMPLAGAGETVLEGTAEDD